MYHTLFIPYEEKVLQDLVKNILFEDEKQITLDYPGPSGIPPPGSLWSPPC